MQRDFSHHELEGMELVSHIEKKLSFLLKLNVVHVFKLFDIQADDDYNNNNNQVNVILT
jgi:hypothetical protein